MSSPAGPPARPLRVLFVTDRFPPEVGGTERVSHALASGLVRRGHAVEVLVPAVSTELATGRQRRDGVDVERFPVGPADPIRLYRAVARDARRLAVPRLAGVDLVHLHGPMTGRGFLDPLPRPRVYTYYGPWHLEYLSEVSHRRYGGLKGLVAWAFKPLFARWLRGGQRALLRAVPCLVTLSEHSRRELGLFDPALPGRARVIPGAADPARFRTPFDRPAARRALGLPQDRPVLFSVRRLVPRMGLDLLIEALARLAAHPDALLCIAGRGPERERLEALARDRGVAPRTRFLGYLEDRDLATWMRAADAVVIPTRELEGFGLPVVESWVAGTPVVVTPAGALPELVERVDRELVARAIEPDALAEALGRALEPLPPGREERRRALARGLDIEALLDATLGLYGELLGSARPRV